MPKEKPTQRIGCSMRLDDEVILLEMTCLKCYKCGHLWEPKPGVQPKACPRCHAKR